MFTANQIRIAMDLARMCWRNSFPLRDPMPLSLCGPRWTDAIDGFVWAGIRREIKALLL
ncbi:hypothetical protein RBSWK_04069 [Rhodopirellula baltica SWK14]|uniref:Uncharacterized protein n=1 Tax=Rhodopirellula baltica SWK14 TaxID=993516 RepID=L7CCI0_RHOBT|nr:hypothetical protein RBSWK_04069 [Rhodopirellula baltica SWK14]